MKKLILNYQLQNKKMNIKDFFLIFSFMYFAACISSKILQLTGVYFNSEESENWVKLCLYTPFVEELFFRLPLLIWSIVLVKHELRFGKNFLVRCGIVSSFLIISLTFSSIHIRNLVDSTNYIYQIYLMTLPHFIGAVILGLVTMKYKCGIFYSFLLHGLYNFMVTFI